jgi:hypothetical protein
MCVCPGEFRSRELLERHSRSPKLPARGVKQRGHCRSSTASTASAVPESFLCRHRRGRFSSSSPQRHLAARLGLRADSWNFTGWGRILGEFCTCTRRRAGSHKSKKNSRASAAPVLIIPGGRGVRLTREGRRTRTYNEQGNECQARSARKGPRGGSQHVARGRKQWPSLHH